MVFICNIIAFAAAIVAVIEFLGIGDLAYELGRESTTTTFSPKMWLMLLKAVNVMGIVVCCILFFVIAARARKNTVFVVENESLLMTFGLTVGITGFISTVLIHIFDYKPQFAASTCNLLILLGLVFVFFSFILKIGRRLQEEQELTI